MVHRHTNEHVSDEDRREFLKTLGVAGTVTAGGVTLEEIREATSTDTSEELARIGQAIHSDLAGDLDASLITEQQAALEAAANELPLALERGLPENGPREEFGAVAEAGWPIYEHLKEVGFFESTAGNLPQFTPEYLESSVAQFVASESLAAPLAEVGFDQTEMVEIITPVITQGDRLSRQLWLTTEQIPSEGLGKYIPPMTMQSAAGVLLWAQDIDLHLWQDKVLLNETILADITWNAHAMAAGFQMMTEGARVIAEGSGALSENELASLLSTGFALQTIAQHQLPVEGYWITEEMRGSRRTDLETVTKDLETIKAELMGGL